MGQFYFNQLQKLRYTNNPNFLEKYQKICKNEKRIRFRHLRHLIVLALPDENEFIKQKNMEFIDIKKILDNYDIICQKQTEKINFLTEGLGNEWTIGPEMHELKNYFKQNFLGNEEI